MTGISLDARYVAIGPFRAGGYIRELRFTGWGASAVYFEWAAVVSPTENATEEQFRAATPVISRSNRQVMAGQLSWRVRLQAYALAEFAIPMSRRVDAGALHVLIGVKPETAREISILATVTVIGLARMGADGLGVEDGLDR